MFPENVSKPCLIFSYLFLNLFYVIGISVVYFHVFYPKSSLLHRFIYLTMMMMMTIIMVTMMMMVMMMFLCETECQIKSCKCLLRRALAYTAAPGALYNKDMTIILGAVHKLRNRGMGGSGLPKRLQYFI